MKETAVTFGQGKSLVGILTDPATQRANSKAAAILLNAGIIHRVGPGRMYVDIARQLASQGVTAFRFDFSGIGDSKPRRDNLPFEKSSVDETRSAIDFLEAHHGIRRFVLIGGCSGARVSFATASGDRRVCGSILINFQITSDEDRERTPDSNRRQDEHYYLRFAVRNYQSWRKLFTGHAEYRKIFGVVTSRLRRTFVLGNPEPRSALWAAFRKELRVIVDSGSKPVFVCSDGDPALAELRAAGGQEFAELSLQNRLEFVVIRKSDHTFSSLSDQERLIKAVKEKVSAILCSTPLAASA